MDKPVAVALRYDSDVPAPFVTAVGRGERAERLLELAQAFGVPVQSAPELAERLVTIDVGTLIPEELYLPVAEILAFLVGINQNLERLDDSER